MCIPKTDKVIETCSIKNQWKESCFICRSLNDFLDNTRKLIICSVTDQVTIVDVKNNITGGKLNTCDLPKQSLIKK